MKRIGCYHCGEDLKKVGSDGTIPKIHTHKDFPKPRPEFCKISCAETGYQVYLAKTLRERKALKDDLVRNSLVHNGR